MDEFKDLLDIASSTSNLTNCDFDTFLKEKGFDESDTSKRILIQDLFLFYTHWYYNKYQKIPHRSNFAKGSEILKLYKLRQRYPGTKKLAWGIRCSASFRIAYLLFKKDTPEWQQKLTKMLNAKKAHRARKINRKEQRQLEKLISSLASTQDSSQK